MVDNQETLHIGIAGEWSAYQMAEFVMTIDELYSELALLTKILDLQEQKISGSAEENIISNAHISQIEEVLFDNHEISGKFLRETEWMYEYQLKVSRVSYGSDGSWDFAGIGTAVRAVSDFLSNILNYVGDREKRRKKCLENAEKVIAICQKAGHSAEQIEKLTRKALRKCGYIIEQIERNALPAPLKKEGETA